MWVGFLVGVAFVALGVYLGGLALRSWRQARETTRWPRTEGEILESWVESKEDSEGDLSYRPVIRYRYQVADQSFEGDLVSVGARNLYGSFGWAQGAVDRYSEGDSVDVYFDPQEPAQAVLEPEVGRGPVALTFLALLGLVIGMVLLRSAVPAVWGVITGAVVAPAAGA